MTEEIKTCYHAVQGLLPLRAPERIAATLRSRWPQVPTNVVRRLFALASGQLNGPDALSDKEFSNRWLLDNNLFNMQGGGLCLMDEWGDHSPQITQALTDLIDNVPGQSAVAQEAIPRTVAVPAGQHQINNSTSHLPSTSNSQAQAPTPPLPNVVERRQPPEVPVWGDATRGPKRCSCCTLKRRVEVHSKLCITCWQHCFPNVKPLKGKKLSYELMSCECATAQRALSGANQQWTGTSDVRRCKCCGKNGRFELIHRRCAKCWPMLFPNDPIQLDQAVLNRILGAQSTRSTLCNCYD